MVSSSAKRQGAAAGAKGVKKPQCVKEEKPQVKKLGKNEAKDFLKKRQGAKLGDLRAELRSIHGEPASGSAAAAMAVEKKRAAEKEAQFNRCSEAENTRKKFYVELRKVIRAADIIIEVLDARDPGSCRSVELEQEITGTGKKLVLLLNKIDLVPQEAVEAWMAHLKRSFPVIAFKAALGGAQRPFHAQTDAAKASEGVLNSSHTVLGADDLMQLLKNYARLAGGRNKAHLSVGVVGYPNTGKSSVINSMKRHAAVETGGRAGVTKEMQEVKIDQKITLIDSPGVVFEGASNDPSVVLRNVVRVENVEDPVGVVETLVQKAPREALLEYYDMFRDFTDVNHFLFHVAKMRGKLKRGGGLDLASTAKSIISDWTTGKFRYYVMPLAADAAATAAALQETVELVSEMAPKLDIDALFNEETAGDAVVLGAPEEEDEDMGVEGQVKPVEVDM